MLVVAVDRNRNGLPVGDLFRPQIAEANYELTLAGLRAAQREDRAVDAVLIEALLAFHLSRGAETIWRGSIHSMSLLVHAFRAQLQGV